ncbi:Leucine-rich repeat - like 10 [Theobroma cacao]|nr:Leucine-rich repeat - like 10 [Theobroma cacao]
MTISGMCLRLRSFLFLFIFYGLFRCMKIANGLNPSAREEKFQCLEKERQALLMVKQSLIDDYGQLSSWGNEDGKKDCCLWKGVRCSNRTHHVVRLDLSNSGIVINPSLLELQHLRYLDLSGNYFGGSVFPNLNGSLRKLTHLNLNNAELSSKIVNQLGNLSELQFLDLSGNSYNISKLDWLHGLSSLRHLDLSYNNLNDAKDWPQILNKLPYLEDLKLSGCRLPRILFPPSLTNSTSSSFSIDLSRNDLTSSMYPLLFNITSNIVDLNLDDNSLGGSIPNFFRNMISLKHLSLSINNFEGDIPKFLGNMCTLETLDLSSNNFNGPIAPGFFGCLENSLQILDLSANRFHGPLMLPYIARFSSLRELYLSNNRLNVSLSKSFNFKQPSKLAVLYLSRNQLTGTLPDFTVLSSLKDLLVSHNQLNGTVPESLGSLSELEYLDVSRNFLKGVISETHFKNLSKLKILDLSSNHLVLNFNYGWVPPFQLNSIYLSSCKLGPHFPKWLQTQKYFRDLDISSAEISDSIPDWFWDLPPYLYTLNLSNNHFSGMLPKLSSLKFSGNVGIDLSSNFFEGPLPLFLSNASSLNLSQNKFSGSLSPLCKIKAEVLNFLDLSSNNLFGVLPDCFVHWQALVVLNLADNSFSGGIPRTFGSLSSSLESINLSNNNFSGDLPSSLKNYSRLKFLDLSNNKLSGYIPAWIGENLSSLIYLSLQSNEFKGKMPATLCQLANIRILDLSLNTISGSIPLCLANLTAMSRKGDSNYMIEYDYWSSWRENVLFGVVTSNYIEKAWVGWKGKIYKYERSLGLLRIIDLAGNKLVGKIPDDITSLSELVALNLSGNNLMGFIPKTIGHLNQLESLDLSKNQLSGQIPDSMANLTFLSFLDLSYNNLSGRIPSSTQLQTINASAFVGNQALCGPPITQQCPEDNKPQGHATYDGHGDEFSKWFYAGMGLGFCLGFWGVCGTLLLKRSWRHAYFRFLDHLNDSLYVTFVLWGARLQRKPKS